MKKMQEQHGITLVALVVTIVVLLILAGVTITNVISDDGIISKAEQAAEAQRAASVEESVGLWKTTKILAEYTDSSDVQSRDELVASLFNQGLLTEDEVDEIEETGSVTIGSKTINFGASWSYNADGNITNGTVILKVGDYIDYSAGTSGTYKSEKADNGYADQIFNVATYTNSGYGWRVLGVDETSGELLIISTDYIGPDSGGCEDYDRTYYRMQDKTAYVNAEKEINAICAIYGNGKGATGATSLTEAQVDALIGHDPIEDDYYPDEIYAMGNEVTYTMIGGIIEYSSKNNVNGSSSYTTFTYYDETVNDWKYLSEGESRTFTQTGDFYDASDSIDAGSTLYELLFLNNSTKSAINSEYKGTTTGNRQWLAGSCVECVEGFVRFCVPALTGGYVAFWGMCDSLGDWNYRSCGVRPVVSLSSDINLTGSSETGWSIQ